MSIGNRLNALAAAAAVAAVSLPAFAQDWQAGAGPEWQKMLSAARAEGKVVVAGPPDIGKPMAEGFKRDTGIELEFLGAVGRTMVQRMLREYKSGNVTFDVVFSGAITLSMQKYMQPLRDKLVLPGVTDPKNWVGGKLHFADNAGTYIPYFCEQVSGWPLANVDIIKPGTIKTWQDLLKPEYKGKITIYDPRVPGPGVANSAYIADALGLDYVKKLYVDQQPKLSRNGRQMAEWVARGVYPIGLGVSFTEVNKFWQAGMKSLQPIDDIQGAPLRVTAGFYPHVPLKAPHPNAALVFMNWYGSKPGQEINSRAQVQGSLRTDVDVKEVPNLLKPKPGVKYLDQYEEDFALVRRTKLVNQVREILKSVE